MVRDPGLRSFKYMHEALDAKNGEALTCQGIEFGIRLVVSCAVDPPLTNDPEQAGKDAGDGKVYVDIEDLGLTDGKALIEQCTAMINAEEAEKEIAPLSQTSESLSD